MARKPRKDGQREFFVKYDVLAVEHKLSYNHEAQSLMAWEPFLCQELCNLLWTTKENFPYKAISAHLGSVLNTNTIINHIQSLKGFKHHIIKLLPLLGEASKKRKLIWAETFWFFWKSASALAPKIKMILYHMDEKWFYAVVTRSKYKVVTSIGLESENNFVQHRNHVVNKFTILSLYMRWETMKLQVAEGIFLLLLFASVKW